MAVILILIVLYAARSKGSEMDIEIRTANEYICVEQNL